MPNELENNLGAEKSGRAVWTTIRLSHYTPEFIKVYPAPPKLRPWVVVQYINDHAKLRHFETTVNETLIYVNVVSQNKILGVKVILVGAPKCSLLSLIHISLHHENYCSVLRSESYSRTSIYS